MNFLKSAPAPLILSLLLLLPSYYFGQEPIFKRYSTKEGLPSAEMYEVFQDSKGYIWIAGDAGVSRFDGNAFKNFNISNGLPDNTVFGFFEDHKQRLWLRSFSGKLSYFLNDSLYTLPINKEIIRQTETRVLTSLFVDQGDTLWIGVNYNRYLKLWKTGGAYKLETISTLPHNIYIIYDENKKNNFFWGGLGTNMFFNSFSNRSIIRQHSIPHRIVPHPRVIRLNSKDWILADENMLWKFDENRNLISRVKMPGRTIALYEDRSKNLWVGVQGKGAACFANGNLDKKPSWYFRGRSITSILQDTEHAFWFSTLTEGIYYQHTKAIRNYDLTQKPDKNVRTFLPLNDGTIAVGMSSGEVFIMGAVSERKLKVIANFDFPIEAIITDRDSNLWLTGGGLIGVFKVRKPYVKPGERIIPAGKSLCIWQDSILVIGSNSGMHGIPGLGIQLIRVIKMLPDTSGKLWQATTSGLWMFDGKTNNYFGDKYPLLSNRIDDLAEAEPGILFLATKGEGLLIFNTLKKEIKRITIKEGLASNVVNTIYMDNKGIIWAGTNNGLNKIKYTTDNYLIETIDKTDGLISNNINCITRENNKLWVGTKEGLSIIDLEEILPNSTPPPVYITAIKVHNIPLTKKKKKINLNYDQNFISISFVGPTYKNAGEVLYKLKMEGIDKSWAFTKNPEIQYTTMPPGNYNFKVLARNNDGIWSSKPAEIEFNIHEPYWQTGWFKTMIAVLGIGLVTIIILVRYKQLKRIESDKNLLYKKILETELVALRAQMNPHFIFNALNSIQSFILQNDVQSAHKYLGKFSRLIRKVLINSKAEMVSLAEELETLKLYIELEAVRFKNKFDYEIDIDAQINPDTLIIPTLIIQPFVENAIWHGLMNNLRKGYLKISMEYHENNIIKSVIEDNGIGREKAKEMQQASQQEHESMGINATKERLEAINSKYKIALSLNIIDLYDNSGKSVGTRVELFFPKISYESNYSR